MRTYEEAISPREHIASYVPFVRDFIQSLRRRQDTLTAEKMEKDTVTDGRFPPRSFPNMGARFIPYFSEWNVDVDLCVRRRFDLRNHHYLHVQTPTSSCTMG